MLAAGEEHVAGLAAALDQVAGQGDQRHEPKRSLRMERGERVHGRWIEP
jgi:hypothetical protein